MEWTREKTLALIQEYRKRRGLWDMTHEDYRKKEVKHKLLVEVGDSLGGSIPIMEIEKKFHTLRTQYHREINRMKRKEPYNSKWFGFKCLQFLSSPKACRRSNKGSLKEITEEGTVTTKYIIREAIPVQHDTSVESGNDNEEFLTLQRRPTTITYEVPAGNTTSTSSSRSHELEKLIEETTKDVEEIEEAKPKMTMKEITVPMEHQQHHHTDNYSHSGSTGELQITNVETEHEDLHHIEDNGEQIDTINIHTASDEELSYHHHHHHTTANSNNGGGNGTTIGVSSANAPSTTTVHTIPARIIKIQRRDTHDQTPPQQQQHEYYEQHHTHHHPQPQTAHHIQTVSPGGATKRIYYDTATILTTTPTQQQSSAMTILNATSTSTSAMTSPQSSKLHLRSSLVPPLPSANSSTPLCSSTSTMMGTPAMVSIPAASNSTLRDEYVSILK